MPTSPQGSVESGQLSVHVLAGRAHDWPLVATAEQLRAHGLDIVMVGRAELERCPRGIVIVSVEPGLAGVRTACDVLKHAPGCRLMAVTPSLNERDVVELLLAGVAGCCEPDAQPAAVARLVRAVIAEEVTVPRRFLRAIVESLRRIEGHTVDTDGGEVHLTDREWDVFRQLRQGRSTHEIATALFVSDVTVRTHIAHVRRKLGLNDRSQLMRDNPTGR